MSILASVSNEPVTDRKPLVEYFAKAAKPKSGWLIGCEHEKFPFRLSSLKPVSYEEPNGLRELYQGMETFGWVPVMEGENIIGLSRGKAAISFEPGGQVELAGSPFANLHEVAAETDQHFVEICEIGDRLGIGFLGIGFHPTARREDISWVPKQRYKIMRAYMPKVGTRGVDMMLRTCTVQVNLDFSDEADMVKKFRTSLALQPIATALFSTSPFLEGKPSGLQSGRMNAWLDTDNARSGAPEFVYENGFGYERYTDYALDVPMYFVYRDGHYIDCAGQSFRDFMLGKLPAMPGEIPSLTDWANHLTTLFPDVRLKKVLEMRGEDSGPSEMLQALPSFWVGLLYDDAACDAAWDIAKNWSAENRARLHADVPKLGLNAETGSGKVLDVARNVLAIARTGLRRRSSLLHGADEAAYLDPLFKIVETGQTHASWLLQQSRLSPDFPVKKLFETERLQPPSQTPDYIKTPKVRT